MIAEINSNPAISGSNLARTWLNRLGPLLGLVLVIATFAILMGEPERYLSPKNLRTVLAQTVIVAIGAIGMTMIIISGGIDLSVGSSIALTGAIAALGINAGLSPTLASGAGILACRAAALTHALPPTQPPAHPLFP